MLLPVLECMQQRVLPRAAVAPSFVAVLNHLARRENKAGVVCSGVARGVRSVLVNKRPSPRPGRCLCLCGAA